eukprot:TRINITY_DN4869_c0_g1_i1.p1 TRINITY_DN4869_c0_g1~~TRINITY_DN4869_c0_g1_i1.p1  ORF type:complete len:655 (-),score=157.58 TRINITY_DN4869_c0_g1_i1:8-1972(-)
MATMLNLENSVINLESIRSYEKQSFLSILETSYSSATTKALIFDPKIVGPLGLIADAHSMMEKGVTKFHQLTQKLDTDCGIVIYLIRPKIEFMKIISGHIKRWRSEKKRVEVLIVFCPRRTMVAEKLLEEEGVDISENGIDNVRIAEYKLELIPLDTDILSMEVEHQFRECYLDGDKSSLYNMAKGIMTLQAAFGIIPHIKAKGACAKNVVDMILRMRKESGGVLRQMTAPTSSSSNAKTPNQAPNHDVPSEIDTMIILDRTVDMITPMITQLTYEGLVDEIFGVSYGHVDLDPSLLPPQKDAKGNTITLPQDKLVKTPLNSNDTLYVELRDLNITAVGPFIRRKVAEVDEYYKRKEKLKQGSVSMIRDFTRGLPRVQKEHNSAILHTNVARRINKTTESASFNRRLRVEQGLLINNSNALESALEYIDEMIGQQAPIQKLLRTIIVLCLTQPKLSPKILENLKKEVIESYGFEQLFTFQNLEKLGLFGDNTSSSSSGQNEVALTLPNGWNALKKHFSLFVSVNEKEPNDIAYVYSGYAPLSIRFVQRCTEPGGWRMANEVLPGTSCEVDQDIPNRNSNYSFGGNNRNAAASSGASVGMREKLVTLVVFLGGVTMTEIAALRWLSQQPNSEREYIIITTGIINGGTLLDSLIQK